MNRIRITSLDDPRLDVFRDLKTTNRTRRQPLFVAEGTTLVERLFHSRYEVTAVLASEQKLVNFAHRIPAGTTVYEVSRDLASVLVGYKFHLGVVAAAVRQPGSTLQEIIDSDDGGLIVIGDHLIDPENVGALIRISAAFGAQAVVLSRGSADAFSRRVLRVSMGNGLFLPVVEGVESRDAVASLRAAGWSCCATVAGGTAVELSAFSFPRKTAMVFGNETHGVQPTVIADCDHGLTISMLNGTDSVNVAVAAGIFCHTYRCQQPAGQRSLSTAANRRES
ncbi:MAG: RNA methyltransferase [Fuerstiella sp.]